MNKLAIISNEPTPYRLHVLERIADELPEVETYNIFTHTVSDPSMPWAVNLKKKLRPTFFSNCHLSSGFNSPLGALRLFRAMRKFILEQQVSMVILLGYNDLARLLLIRWAKKHKLPLLLTGDSNIFGQSRGGVVKRCLKKCVVRWVIKRVAGLMPMGVAGRAFFRSYADHDLPTFLFPYEPDYKSLVKEDDTRRVRFLNAHNLDPDRHRLLFCGRLASVKRVGDLIDAFAVVALERPKWDLLIAGDGELKAKLQAAVPQELRQRITWTGFLQFEDIAACYHCCDVLVLPSEYEPWAVVINEAVACGLAVITTEVVGAAIELVRHKTNGMIIPPRDVNALADAIRETTDPHVCQWMKNASPEVLRQWRRAADPVEGVKSALRYFNLLTEHE